MKDEILGKLVIASLAAGFLVASFLVACPRAPAFAENLDRVDEIKLPVASSSSGAGSNDELSATTVRRVNRIDILGNWLISSKKIKSVIKTKEGDDYDRERIAKDLRALFDLGYFESESLKAIPQIHGDTVDILFQVSEAPVLQDVSLRGSGKIVDAEMKSVFDDLVGWPVAQWRLQAGILKIQKLCVARGFENCFVISDKTKYVADPELYAFSDLDRIKSSGFGGQAPVLMRTVLKAPLRSTDSFTLDLLIAEQPNSPMRQNPSTERGITLPFDGQLFSRSSSRPLRIRWIPWPKPL